MIRSVEQLPQDPNSVLQLSELAIAQVSKSVGHVPYSGGASSLHNPTTGSSQVHEHDPAIDRSGRLADEPVDLETVDHAGYGGRRDSQ